MNSAITAYRNRERVSRYDADMDLMHPNRHKMVDMTLSVLPFPADVPVRCLELGIGTGFFADKFLDRYSRGRLVGLDGSAAMLTLAETRLHDRLDRVELLVADFEMTDLSTVPDGSIDLVFSAYSLHHLKPAAKQNLLCTAVQKLKPGGWLMNADLVSCPFPEIASIILNRLAAGILDRNGGRDPRFLDLESTLNYISNLQANENDQPLTADRDLSILRQAGIDHPYLFWKEHIEAVMGGLKSSPRA